MMSPTGEIHCIHDSAQQPGVDDLPTFARLMARVAAGDAGDGVKAIAYERRRQMTIKGFDAEHDDSHEENELAHAVGSSELCLPVNTESAYAGYMEVWPNDWDDKGYMEVWPNDWDDKWKPEHKANRTRQLVIAGALIAAEIDRINRGLKE